MDSKIIPINSATAENLEVKQLESILPPLLSIQEVCDYLSLGQTKVREIIRKGEIPHTRVRSRIRIFATDLRDYLEQNRG